MIARIWMASPVAIGIFGVILGVALAEPSGAPSKPAADDKNWQAVAPGLVEPRAGEIKIAAPAIGVISEVMVQSGDKVMADEPMIRLDDESARARVAGAQAQAEMRKRARNDQGAGKGADRRKAEDSVAEAEAAVMQTQESFDAAAKAKRSGGGSDGDVAAARTAWSSAQERLAQRRTQLRKLDDDADTPLPTANEGQLNVSRGELRGAFAELQKLTIRAPMASTVLQVNAKLGELASPAALQPLVLLGDLTGLRVRAEVDERDVGKIKLGGKAVVHADAFRDREFAGKVVSIAPLVQPARINSPGSRNLSDFSVADVLIELSDPGPLLDGMKVDVYFQHDVAAQ
jgi:HlyD family secretion protein